MSARDEMKPLFEQFSWLPSGLEDDVNAKFAAKVLAVTSGCSTVANLIRRNEMAADNGDPPLLPRNDADFLIGLMIFSVDTLRDMAEDALRLVENLEQFDLDALSVRARPVDAVAYRQAEQRRPNWRQDGNAVVELRHAARISQGQAKLFGRRVDLETHRGIHGDHAGRHVLRRDDVGARQLVEQGAAGGIVAQGWRVKQLFQTFGVE